MDEILADKIQFASKRWLPKISLAFAIILMVPTVAIMASWNSLPGDRLYPTKRYLEGVALKLVGNNFTARADLQSQYVEHRFNEAETMLTVSSSTAGFDDLVQQIQSAKTDIIAAKERVGSKDQEQAEQESQKLVAQLKEYNQKLEDSKKEIRTNTSTSPNQSSKPKASPEVSTSPKSQTKNQQTQATPLPTVVASPMIVGPSEGSSVQEVDIVQQEIAKVVEELEHKGAKKDDEKEEKEVKGNRNENDNKNDKNEKDKKDDKEKQKDKKD